MHIPVLPCDMGDSNAIFDDLILQIADIARKAISRGGRVDCGLRQSSPARRDGDFVIHAPGQKTFCSIVITEGRL